MVGTVVVSGRFGLIMLMLNRHCCCYCLLLKIEIIRASRSLINHMNIRNRLDVSQNQNICTLYQLLLSLKPTTIIHII